MSTLREEYARALGVDMTHEQAADLNALVKSSLWINAMCDVLVSLEAQFARQALDAKDIEHLRELQGQARICRRLFALGKSSDSVASIKE